MSEHALVIPPEGIMQILHHESTDPEKVLRALFPTEAPFVSIGFHDSKAGFFPMLDAPWNPRAREALRILTGAHMVFTGPVIFTGVPTQQLGEVVATLSVDQ